MQLVHRAPRRDMIRFGSNGEHRRTNIGESHRTSVDAVAAFGKVVVEE